MRLIGDYLRVFGFLADNQGAVFFLSSLKC